MRILGTIQSTNLLKIECGFENIATSPYIRFDQFDQRKFVGKFLISIIKIMYSVPANFSGTIFARYH